MNDRPPQAHEAEPDPPERRPRLAPPAATTGPLPAGGEPRGGRGVGAEPAPAPTGPAAEGERLAGEALHGAAWAPEEALADGEGWDGDEGWQDDEGWDDDEDWQDDEGWDGDADYVTLRGEASRGRRVLALLGAAALVLVLALGGAGLWVSRQLAPAGGPGDLVEVEIPQGATSSDIGALLADEGIIASDFVWGWYLRINGGGPFQAGFYELPRNSAMGDVVDLLTAGPRPLDERSFTIPEGLTVREIVARLADPERGLGFDAATMEDLLDRGHVRSAYQPPGQPSNEGILFPETYRVAADADELAVLQLMVAQLDAVMAELGVATAQERFGLSPYEVLVVASLIEEETKVDAERPQVARVIYNRLRQGIPLGIDATSRYEAELAGRSREEIDFDSDSPYNTRKQAGLPPTPIASPGRASIAAALEPAEGPWIYYVLEDAEGNHFFTESYREFLAAKERCARADLGCG